MYAEYKRDMSHNYLILHGENPVDTSSYQVRMLTGNAVPSILKCRIQGLDGNFLFYYDITSRQSLASFYELKKLQVSDIRLIFGGVVKIMEEMMEFLLNPDQLLLSPEYMYLDVEKQKMYFCCLPGEPKTISEQFREMTEYFLPKLDHEEASAVTMGYGIYRKALENGICLEMIKEIIYRNVPETSERRDEETKPVEAPLECLVLPEEKVLDPGEKKAEKKEKNKRKTIDGRLLWIGGCALGVFLLLGVAVACYLGYLPEVPIEAVLLAAIVLLGIGALGSWLSKKNQKKKNETLEWRQKVKKEIAGKSEKLENFQSSCKNVSQDTKPHEYHKSESSDESFGFGKNLYTGSEKREEENYGETMLLSSGSVKGPASLVSREPGELATIFLEQDLTVIGKLENAADAVIPRATVSRVHARIRKEEEGYFLADLNSRNGTSVNGRLLRANEEYQLQDEDEVDFAEARYVFIK